MIVEANGRRSPVSNNWSARSARAGRAGTDGPRLAHWTRHPRASRPGRSEARTSAAERSRHPGAGSGATAWGAVTELALYNDEFAVKVTEVDVGSPAASAGLRPGVVIVEANGKPVLHPSELDAAIRSSGRTCRLTVVDPGTGRKSAIDVNLGTGGF